MWLVATVLGSTDQESWPHLIFQPLFCHPLHPSCSSCISWLDVIQLCCVFGVLLCPACLPPYLTSHLAMFGSFLSSLFRCGQVLRPLLTQPPSPVNAKGILLWALIALVQPAHCDWCWAYLPPSCWRFQDMDKTLLIFKFPGLSTWEGLQNYLSCTRC